jgi:hypothetical protein
LGRQAPERLQQRHFGLHVGPWRYQSNTVFTAKECLRSCSRGRHLAEPGAGVSESGASWLPAAQQSDAPFTVSSVSWGSHSAVFNELAAPGEPQAPAYADEPQAIANAWRQLVLGEADIAICGGVETKIEAVPIAGFAQMRIVLSNSNDDPQGVLPPLFRRLPNQV